MSSRVKVAHVFANDLKTGKNRSQSITRVAAWLQENHKTRQASYLVQDVMQSLAASGYLFARITTAHTLPAKTRATIESFLLSLDNVKELECDYHVDRLLIGGVRIDTPLGVLDASIRARLAKIVEGVSR